MKKHLAIFTIIQNESLLLDIWLEHYRNQIPACDLFVLDHQTEGQDKFMLKEMQRRYEFNLLNISHKDSMDWRWIRGVSVKFQHFLFKSYNYTLYTDVDEIVFTDPTLDISLPDFCTKEFADFDGAICTTGYNVIQGKEEGKFDLSKPLFEQRKWWIEARKFCKPILSNVEMLWTVGSHRAQCDVLEDKGLYLVHLHRFDYEHTRERHEKFRGKPISRLKRNRDANSYRLLGDEAFDEWYYSDYEDREEIPDKFRHVKI